jgi:Zn-dependent metalloprotease
MERTNVRKLILLVMLIVLLPGCIVFGQGPPKGTPEARAEELRNLLDSIEGISGESPRIHLTKDGYLRFIMAPSSAYFPVEPAKRGTPQDAAGAFLAKWRNLFVSESPDVTFDAIRTVTRRGYTYVRYQQKYVGLDVFTAQMTIEVTNNGGIGAVMSDIMRDSQVLDSGEVSLSPSIDALTAQKNAIDWVAIRHGQIQLVSSVPTLMIFEPGVVGWEGETKLVWHTKVRSLDEMPVHLGILVNTQSADIAFYYSLLHYLKPPREIWEYDPIQEALVQPLYRDENGSYPPFPHPNGVANAWEYLDRVHDFYWNQHQRNGINGQGMTSQVGMYNGYSDSFWQESDPPNHNGFMVFGYGLEQQECGCVGHTVQDDCVGHEYTHGVTDYTSHLLYAADESGAINESFSDMWGEWLDLSYHDDGDDDWGERRWWLFEDYFSVPKPYRNMKNPHDLNAEQKGPEIYKDELWYYDSDIPTYTHTNCAVGNKLCYLLTDGSIGEPGGQFNGHTISGMGISNTAALFYECQTGLLLEPSSDYYDLGDALIWAADRRGLLQDDRNNIKNACAAVEILPYPDDCFPICHTDYVDWVLMDRPNCWCYLRQCHGDTDNQTEGGPKTGYYYVHFNDLNVLIAGWDVREPALPPIPSGPGIVTCTAPSALSLFN